MELHRKVEESDEMLKSMRKQRPAEDKMEEEPGN
jgi:hypothetical protein